MIIGLNMQDLMYYKIGSTCFSACDVSWISQFPEEKEILTTKGSSIPLYKSKIKVIDDQQYIIGDDSSQTFQTMFMLS